MATPRKDPKDRLPVGRPRKTEVDPAIAKAICDNLELAMPLDLAAEAEGSAARQSAQHADEGVTAVFPRACIGEALTRRRRQSQCIIEFAIRGQARIRRDNRSAKLNHHASVEIRPENAVLRFTRRVRQLGLISSA